MVELYTYCSLNKQYVEDLQSRILAYLTSVGNITMSLYRSLVGMRTTPFCPKK